MNKNSSKFAVQVSSPNLAEACQRIAFTFGYAWINGIKDRVMTDSRINFIIFNPETKVMQWSTYRLEVEPLVNQIVRTFDELITLFTNPPKPSLRVGTSEIFPDGAVKVGGVVTVSSALWDELVKERNAYLGHKEVKKLPIVDFLYNSKSSGQRGRRVAVLDTGEDGIQGLDLNDGNKFKKFLREKMVTTPTFVGFTE